MNDTLWNCRIQAIRAVLGNFGSLVTALEEIAENNKLTGHDAHISLKSMTDFSFLFCLKLTRNVLEFINQLSVNLQNRQINFSAVTGLSKATISSVTHLCSDDSFNKLWVEVQALAKEEGCGIQSLPRKRKIPGRIGGGSACGELVTPST